MKKEQISPWGLTMMTKRWLMGSVGLMVVLWASGACAAPAPPIAQCVTVKQVLNGVTQEFCVPVTPASPLPMVDLTPPAAGVGGPVIAPLTTGTQYYPAFAFGLMATLASPPTQNVARCTVFNWQWTSHVDRIGLQITTAGASGPINLAIYSDGVDATSRKHQPQTLLTDPATTFPTTGVGGQSIAIGTPGVGISMPIGLYWICVNDAAAADAVRYPIAAGTTTNMSTLVGSTLPVYASSNGPLQSVTTNIAAGTTSANWPSFVGVAFADANGSSAPAISLEVATVP